MVFERTGSAMLPATSSSDLLRTTETLVRIPSVSRDRHTCHEVLETIGTMIPNLDSFHTEIFEHEGYQSLIVGTRPGRAAPLILNGHVDVVTAHDHQFHPELRADGHLWGRGVYDMKGAVAVFVELLKKLAEVAVEDRPHLQVQFVSDEEIGGHRGVERMVEEIGVRFIHPQPGAQLAVSLDLGVSNDGMDRLAAQHVYRVCRSKRGRLGRQQLEAGALAGEKAVQGGAG